MAVICLGVALDEMNPVRLKVLHDAFRVNTVAELIGAEDADDVFAWISRNVGASDRLVVVVDYDGFGEVELIKLLEGLEARGLGEDVLICGFEKVQRGEKTMEELSEYFLEGGPFEPTPSRKELSVQPITGVYTAS